MAEEAPSHLAPNSGQFDDDLINYEADDIIAEPVATGRAASGGGIDDDLAIDLDAANGAVPTKTDTTLDLQINEIDWEGHGDANGNSKVAQQSAAMTSIDLGIDGSGAELPVVEGNTGLDAVDAEDLDANLDHGAETGDSLEVNGATAEHATDHGADEITYDEDDVVEATKGETEEDLIDYESYPDDPLDQPQAPVQEAVDETDHLDIEGEEDATDGAGADGEQQSDEQSGEDEEYSADQPGACPDITVNYRNEEFPLFHGQNNIETQMGFFEDQGILDLTINILLDRFRQELSDDVGAEDEFVLQIDELGLEYAESTHPDHCTGVTLRQIHEIFEHLVKNQDPDASRTMYTNLIIRPHPQKRFDQLIEDAYNNQKGLDEVTYSFQAHAGGQLAVEKDDDVEMYGDEESSDADDDGSGGAADEEEGQDEEQVQDEDEEEEEEGSSHEGGSEEDAENDGASADYDQEYGAEDGELDENPDIDINADLDTFPEIKDQGEVHQTQEDTAPTAFETTNMESEQLTHAVDDAGEVDENAGFDLVDLVDDDLEIAAVEPDQADRVNTSATATLNGDGDNEISYEEDEVDLVGDATTAPATAAADGEAGAVDDFDEIDWREPGDVEAEGDSKEAGSGSAKRPYSEVDVDLGLDDESDVKRRRSEHQGLITPS